MQPGVRLLGTPSIREGVGWHELPLDKRLALLTYLACSAAWVSREHLSFLFWPDTSSANARINLRQLLARTKTLPLSVAIEADDKRLKWAVVSDVSEFRTAVHDANWAGAIRAYRGDLATGLVVSGAGEFMSWLEFERDQLRESHRHAVLHEAETAVAAGRSEEAAAHYEALLLRDPLDESVMQALLRLLVSLGAVEEARRRLQTFAARLQAELGFAPSSATELIVSSAGVRHGHGGEPALSAAISGALSGVLDAPSKHARLDAPLTSFVGREQELASIAERLESVDCRLLTLVGPAGVGKTRLALRAAHLFGSSFAHGAVPVPLANVEDAEALPLAIAAALGLELRRQGPPLDQLVDFFAARETLLVLDNFEHLTQAALVVQELLSGCPTLTVLVTSRQRLRLQSEWLLPVAGLSTPLEAPREPDAAAVQAAFAHDALVLLNERARQVEPGFTITPHTLPVAIDICRLLEGLPLGIELAAGWLRMRSLDQVRTALASSLDDVASDDVDRIDRHRTLRAAIDHSWELLTPAQRSGLRSLAVFTDGCDSAAARSVAGVSLPLLRALSEKSLLRGREGGRFDAHPLILRYMQERLAEPAEVPSGDGSSGDETSDDEPARLEAAHADYFVRLLASWGDRIHGPEQPTMLVQLAPDYGNISQAWLVAIERGWARRCLEAIETLVLFHGLQGRFNDGARLFTASLEKVETLTVQTEHVAVLRATLQANLAWFVGALAMFDEAGAYATTALAAAEELGAPAIEVRALNVLGSISSRRGDNATARGLLEKSLAVSEAIDDRWSLGLVLGQLGLLDLRSGLHEEARSYFERALSVNEALGNSAGIVNDLDYLGQLSLATGDVDAAGASFQRGLELAERVRFRLRIPYLKTQLARVRLAQSRDEAATTLAHEGLQVAEELGQRALQAEALELLGRASHDDNERSSHLMRALTLSHALGEVPRILDVLIGFAQLPTPAVERRVLLRHVTEHPAARPAQRSHALSLLEAQQPARPDGPLPSLDDTVRRLLA